MYKIEIGNKVVVNSQCAYPDLVGCEGVMVGERNGIAVVDFGKPIVLSNGVRSREGSKLYLPYESLSPATVSPLPASINGYVDTESISINLKTLLNSVYGVGGLRTSRKLPDKIIFNEEKGKTTLLFANGNGGYDSVSSRTDGKDRFDKMFGLYMAYFKYLNSNKNNTAFMEYMYKEASASNRLRYLKGAVDVMVRDLVEFHSIVEDATTKDVWVREDYEAEVKKEKNRIRKEAELKLKIKAKEAELTRLKGKLK